MNEFFEKNFSFFLNNVKPKLKYIKTEQKNQMGIIVYYETERIEVSNLKSIIIYNTIMMESFKEQVNMFNITINDQVKRTLKFEQGSGSETIRL